MEVFRSEKRFRVLVAGRRFGKTYLEAPELLRAAWKKDALAWYIAPTYRQAKQIAWEPLKRMAAPWVAGKPNESDLSIRLITGGMIALRGAENYDSLRGPGLNMAVFDEFADIDPRAWTEVVRPMLSDRQGRALFAGTPKGFNHFYELANKAKDDAEWEAFSYTTLQGGNVTAAEIEAARRDMDERTFRQEYEASFENLTAGRAYYSFDRSLNVSQFADYSPNLPVHWALDFNINPMCSVLFQVHDFTSYADKIQGYQHVHVHVFDEVYLEQSNTPEACEEFGNRMRKFDPRPVQIPVEVHGDASGRKRSTAGAGSPSDWDQVRAYFSRNRQYPMTPRWKDANPLIRDRIAAVNSMLKTAADERRLLVNPRCKMLTRDLEQVSWKDGAGILDPGSRKELTHISDALGYPIEAMYGLRQAGGYGTGFIA